MSESVGNRPPEQTNTPENHLQPEQLPIDVFENAEQSVEVNPETVALEGLATTVSGLRARVAERRANKAAERVERTAHKIATHNARKEHVDRNYDATDPPMRKVRPRTLKERHQDKRFDKATHDKAVGDVYAYRAEKVFGKVADIKRSGAMTKTERRMAKRDIRKAYRKGELSASEARLKKLEVDAAPLRLDKTFRKMAHKRQDKAALKAESMANKPFKEKRLKYQYDKAVDAVERHNGHANRLRAEHEARKSKLNKSEYRLRDPEYYLDAANMLSLKRSIERESNRRLNERLHAGLVASRTKIEAETELEGIARYFGFKTWDETEEKVPGWLMDGVMQLYGYSEQELEAEAARERGEAERPAPHSQPTELPHDEPVDLLRTAVHESAENNTQENAETLEAEGAVDTATLDFIKEISDPENRGVVYENEIKLLARDIQASIMRFTENIKDPAEKREIIDEIYTDYIADFLGVPQNALRDPEIVPPELTSQILHDIKAAKQELNREESEEAGRIAYNVAQRVSFRFDEQTRDKELTDEQKEDIRQTLFTAALADELGVAPDDLDNLSASEQNLKKKVLARIDQNEKDRLERVAKMQAEEAAKTPEQRRIEADNAALDKLHGTIND